MANMSYLTECEDQASAGGVSFELSLEVVVNEVFTGTGAYKVQEEGPSQCKCNWLDASVHHVRLSVESLMPKAGILPLEQAIRERVGAIKVEVSSLTLEVTYHLFCHILLIKPATVWEGLHRDT